MRATAAAGLVPATGGVPLPKREEEGAAGDPGGQNITCTPTRTLRPGSGARGNAVCVRIELAL